MKLEMLMAMITLGAFGFYFDYMPLLFISLLGILIGFAQMNNESKRETPAVMTRPIVLNLPPGELEGTNLTPQLMGMGFLPPAPPSSRMSKDPFSSVSSHARQMLPFSNYGNNSPLEKMFSGIPFVGNHIFGKILGKK